jgi:hypothetical protein
VHAVPDHDERATVVLMEMLQETDDVFVLMVVRKRRNLNISPVSAASQHSELRFRSS